MPLPADALSLPSSSAAYGGDHSHATLGHLGWTYAACDGGPAGGKLTMAIKQRVRNRFVTLELIKPAP
jgi:phosphoglucomutase